MNTSHHNLEESETTIDTTRCPICAEVIRDGLDELTIKWYQPRRWWVVSHKRDGQGYCGRADMDGALMAELSKWDPPRTG